MTLTPKAWLLKAELLRSVALKWMLVAVSTVMERLGLVGDDGAAETLVWGKSVNIEKIAVRARIGRKPRTVKTFNVIGFLKTFLYILFDMLFLLI